MPDLENIQIHGGIVMRPLAITQIENPADHFTWNSWHMGGLERKWINEGFSLMLLSVILNYQAITVIVFQEQTLL